MPTGHILPRLATGTLLLLYVALLPLLLVQVGEAHPFRDSNGNLIHSVKKHRLDYIDDSKFNFEIKEARLRWNIASSINASKTKKKNRAEIRVNDANGCGVNWIGKVLPRKRQNSLQHMRYGMERRPLRRNRADT